MTRTDQDTWDLASSVGATATMVAAARAVASNEAAPCRTAIGEAIFTGLEASVGKMRTLIDKARA